MVFNCGNLPVIDFSLRVFRHFSSPLAIIITIFPVPNQSTDPTFSSGTAGAGHQPCHP